MAGVSHSHYRLSSDGDTPRSGLLLDLRMDWSRKSENIKVHSYRNKFSPIVSRGYLEWLESASHPCVILYKVLEIEAFVNGGATVNSDIL